MKTVTPRLAKSFSIEDIIDKFEFIASNEEIHKWIYRPEPHTKTSWIENEEGEMERVEVTEWVESLRAVDGYTYCWSSWLNRLFTTDRGMKRGEAQWQERPKRYLHENFKWCYEKQRGGEYYEEDAGQLFLKQESIVKYWLGAQFGFFNWNDTVIQINPAWLFLLKYAPKDKRQLVFQTALQDARIICDIDEDRSQYAINRFEYYLNALCGNRNYHGLETRGHNFERCKEHWLTSHLERTRYAKNKHMSKDDVLRLLPKVGQVIEFGCNGKTQALEAQIPNKYADIYELQESIQEGKINPNYWVPGEFQLRIFTNGGFLNVTHYNTDFLVEEEDLSAQSTGLLEYFAKYSKRIDKDNHFRALSAIKEDMKKHRFFEDTTVAKKSFISDYLAPKLESHGFRVTSTQKYIDGVKTRTLIVQAPKYGREGAKK